ncbi:acyl-CoA N-acyltransferase [Spinellus fusiger]|nr:acyl-CoA N-acyltransferase [Spinellus fusiger]
MSKLTTLDTYFIREAKHEDISAILEIYNERIENSTCLFIYNTVPFEDRETWFNVSKSKGYPIIVAVEKATNKTIAYASYGAFRDKSGFIFTAEISIYIHLDHHYRGLGKTLLKEMIQIAQGMRLRSVIAAITTENNVSVLLFSAFGFKHIGTLHDVGHKFGRYLDGSFYERIFDTPSFPITQRTPSFTPFPWGSYTFGQFK